MLVKPSKRCTITLTHLLGWWGRKGGRLRVEEKSMNRKKTTFVCSFWHISNLSNLIYQKRIKEKWTNYSIKPNEYQFHLRVTRMRAAGQNLRVTICGPTFAGQHLRAKICGPHFCGPRFAGHIFAGQNLRVNICGPKFAGQYLRAKICGSIYAGQHLRAARWSFPNYSGNTRKSGSIWLV